MLNIWIQVGEIYTLKIGGWGNTVRPRSLLLWPLHIANYSAVPSGQIGEEYGYCFVQTEPWCSLLQVCWYGLGSNMAVVLFEWTLNNICIHPAYCRQCMSTGLLKLIPILHLHLCWAVSNKSHNQLHQTLVIRLSLGHLRVMFETIPIFGQNLQFTFKMTTRTSL